MLNFLWTNWCILIKFCQCIDIEKMEVRTVTFFQLSYGPWLMSEFIFSLNILRKKWWLLMKFCVCSVVTNSDIKFSRFQQSYGPWLMLNFHFFWISLEIIKEFFNKILFMHWYICSMLWLIRIIFPNFSTELWSLIDFRIMFMLNILWNNWWIWSNLVVTLIFFIPKHATTNISTRQDIM